MIRPDFAVIIPAYNEEKTIGNIINEVRKHYYPYVVVNDGSTDNTLGAIKSITDDYITYNINKGKGYAIKQGAKYLIDKGYDWLIVMDSDGQANISDIINILKLRYLHPEAKILIGNRLNNHSNMPLVRFLANKIMSWSISLLAGQKIPDTQCWLKIIHKDIFNLDLKCNRFDYESELLIKAGREGYQVVYDDVKCIYSKDIKSKQNYLKDWYRFIKLILTILYKI